MTSIFCGCPSLGMIRQGLQGHAATCMRLAGQHCLHLFILVLPVSLSAKLYFRTYCFFGIRIHSQQIRKDSP